MKKISKISVLFAAWFTIVVFVSCSRETPQEPPPRPESRLGNEYNGGLFPVYIVLPEPVKSAEQIEWRHGSSKIAYRTQKLNGDSSIVVDTVFLYWDSLPKPTLLSDGDSVYKENIYAIINSSNITEPIVIEIKNILHKISSISVDGLSKPVSSANSTLTIAAHPGADLEIAIELLNPFNTSWYPKIEMPEEMEIFDGKLEKIIESDSLFVYKWTVPQKPFAKSSLTLKVKDSGGIGERIYKVNLIIYNEDGSAWVSSESELVKYTPEGLEVARIKDFRSISDFAINSNNGNLFVVDQMDNSFSIYDYKGKMLYRDDSLFISPTSVAVNVILNDYHVWIADIEDLLSVKQQGRLRRYILNKDSLKFASIEHLMPGPIRGLSFNRFQHGRFLWFALPENDLVGYVGYMNDSDLPSEPRFFTEQNWRRPSMVSYDNYGGIAWISDSSRVMAIDTSGKILAAIKGFGFSNSVVNSISAMNNVCFVADILKKTVYKFTPSDPSGHFKGSIKDTSMTVVSGYEITGFEAPTSVSAFSDGGLWVVDRGSGRTVRLNSAGGQTAFGTGLELPSLVKTVQVVE